MLHLCNNMPQPQIWSLCYISGDESERIMSALSEQPIFKHKTNVSNWLNFCIFIKVLKNGCLNVLSTLLDNNNKTATNNNQTGMFIEH